jgi:hypothetical protein
MLNRSQGAHTESFDAAERVIREILESVPVPV